MCNTCSYYTGGCYNNTQANTITGGCTQTCGFQRMCRDYCGNIWVRQNCSSCCNSCGCCSQNNDATSGNANGTTGNGYGCFTICGRLYQGTAQNTRTTQTCGQNVDLYYARQYGGCAYGGCCGGGYATNFTVTDATQ